MENGLKKSFIKLAIKLAAPKKLTQQCMHEIENIIDKGISKLRDLPLDAHYKKRSVSEKYLNTLIETMKVHAGQNKELAIEDLNYAKEKLCPTWPCGD